jgi:uncharacterized protein
MKLELARKIVRTFLDSKHFTSVHFVWHGGEPLLRGRAFFEEILAEQSRIPAQVHYSNAVQTNATHLTDDLLDFLVLNGISIGLSLDGPAAMNDSVRRFQGSSAASPVSHSLSLPLVPEEHIPPTSNSNLPTKSRSPHDITVDAARRLRGRGRDAGAIVVVSASNVDYPEQIYREFKEEGIHMQVNPLMKSGLAATADGQDLGITAEQYGQFLIRLFDVWYDDPEPTIMISPLQNHIGRILGIPDVSHECHFARSCHRHFIGISPDGNMYPCGMFQAEPDFLYGNIESMLPEEIAVTPLFGRITEREMRVLQTCSECAFVDLCYSGCMFHSLKNSNQFAEKDYYCAGYKMYFEHMLQRIHADLSHAGSRSSSEPAAPAAR